jgi:hypothetical protein
MAKTKISEYSSTASNNTDVDGINIAEGMAPSNVNNAMREIMAQLKDWQSGAVSQDMYVNGAFTASGNAVLSADLSVGDDLTVTGDASVGGGFTCTGAAILSSSLSVAGTLAATGSTSLGAATFSGAVIMSSTLAANGNVTVGTSTTNSHTLNGNLTVGSSTSNTLTLNTLLSSGGSTGISGLLLKSRGTSNTPEWGTGISSGTSTTVTGTQVDFVLSANIAPYVNRITVFINSVSFNAAGVARIRVGTSSGLATSGYVGSLLKLVASSNEIDADALSSTPVGIAGFQADSATTTVTGTFVIQRMTGDTWMCSGMYHRNIDGASGINNCSVTLSGALEKISILATTASFDAGTVNIMYE